jgi:hypothetical protein
MDVELADQGMSRDFRMILSGIPGFPDRATAPRASVGLGCLKDVIDSRRGVAPVGLAGFATGLLGLWLGRPLGERHGLALSLIEAGAGRLEFASKTFVLAFKAFIVLAELPQLLKDGEGHGQRVEHLDGRLRRLLAAQPAQLLLLTSSVEK